MSPPGPPQTPGDHRELLQEPPGNPSTSPALSDSSSVTQCVDISPGPSTLRADHSGSRMAAETRSPYPEPAGDMGTESTARQEQEVNENLTVLARQLSNYSQKHETATDSEQLDLKPAQTKSTIGGLANVNPFADPSHPELDPHSPQFDARKWVKLIMRQHARRDTSSGPEGILDMDALRAGVSFRNLNVHGFGRPTDFQKDVANIWLGITHQAKDLFGYGSKTKIQILRDFEGVVRAGEMCMVLGRPGSGCSTFLKTIAGETHGFFVDESSSINYQGIGPDVMHKNFRGEVIYQAETDGKPSLVKILVHLRDY